jgi:hypothetical protein
LRECRHAIRRHYGGKANVARPFIAGKVNSRLESECPRRAVIDAQRPPACGVIHSSYVSPIPKKPVDVIGDDVFPF